MNKPNACKPDPSANQRFTMLPLLLAVFFHARQPNRPAASPKPKTSTLRMADEVLRDRQNRLLGTIKHRPDGRQEIYSPSNRLLGSYFPRTNETRDAANRFVGRGNLLTSLL